jgi:hypothetical protein
MEWLGLKHPLLVHLPLASAFLLPLPLLLAQRAGRGIRPWWVACRYLAWAGFLGLVLSIPSGLAWAKAHGGSYGLAPKGSSLRHHQEFAALSLLVGVGLLWSLHRHRKDHEGLGWWAFIFGCAWSAVVSLGALGGHRMAHGTLQPKAQEPVLPKAAVAPTDPEQDRPVRALDYAALHPIQAEPIRNAAHGDHWVRTWVPTAALGAFESGQPLPAGTLVVLSSQEGRWGRPGPEVGPLWAYEIAADGKPKFQLYWAQVPEDRRPDMGGKERVYWRAGAPELQACVACHASGPSDLAARAKALRPTTGAFRRRR